MKNQALVLCLVACTFSIAKADPIVSVTGPISTLYDAGDSEYLAQSWTTTSSYTNVSISAALESTGTTPLPAQAWLLTAIGPAATPADVLASNLVSLGVGNTAEVSLFSGLTLAAGTYYLLVSGPGDLIDWQFTDSAPTTGPGTVFDGGQYTEFTSLDAAFPPASSFSPYFEGTGEGIMEVTSTAATPEPATWLLMGTGLLGCIGRARHLRLRP